MTTQTVADPVTWTVADHALVRTSCLALPISGAASDRYALDGEQLLGALAEITARASQAFDALHALAGLDAPAGRRAAVLPVRRDALHGRRPSARAADAVRGLDVEIDLWLDAHARADRLAAALQENRVAALADARRRLAEACADEHFARAAALAGPNLLRAVQRCAERGGSADRRAVKSEPTVLRHVLRAATKTTPLTYFAHVGWTDARIPASTDPGHVTAAAHPDLAALGAVIASVVAEMPPDLRPLRLAPGSWTADDRLTFPRAAGGAATGTGTRAELVTLPVRPMLRALLEVTSGAAAGDATPLWITRALAPTATASMQARIIAWIAELHAAGVLVADDVVDPQSTTPLRDAAVWAGHVGRSDLVPALSEVAALTAAWPVTPAAGRPAAAAALASAWSTLPAPFVEQTGPRLSEDVTVRDALLGLGPVNTASVARLSPLFELFDWFSVVRRAHRQRFVAAYGIGGSCSSVAAHAVEYNRLWTDPALLSDPSVLADPATVMLLDLRARVAAQVRNVEDEVTLPAVLLDRVGYELPEVLSRRPASYSVFAQPGPNGAVCINQVYGGWGRFTSRFLRALPAGATAAVGDAIRSFVGPGATPAQLRPVENFAANLHPLVVEDEIAERAGRGSVRLDRVEVVHDVASDSVRFRDTGTGRLLDVLYLGFLVPLALPPHLTPLTNDLGSGLVDLSALRPPRTVATGHGDVVVVPRLRCADAVLARRAWVLAPAVVAAWMAALSAPDAMPEQVIAQFRAHTGLPRHVFVGAGGADEPEGDRGTAMGVEGFVRRMGQLRSQYVDLLDAAHVHHLARALGRFAGAVRIEEAAPVPVPGVFAREVVLETYRKAVTS